MFGKGNRLEKKYSSMEKKIAKSVAANHVGQAISVFQDGFVFYCSEGNYQFAAKCADAFLPQIADCTGLKSAFSADFITNAVNGMEKEGCLDSALRFLDRIDEPWITITVLARHGRAEEIARLMSKRQALTKELVHHAISAWEEKNGDFRNNPSLSGMIRSIGQSSKDVLPDNPRMKEWAGYYEEAACLYEKAGKPADAARCYEQLKAYEKAHDLYARADDQESVSRMAEALGNYDEALRTARNPYRKIELLLHLNMYAEALRYAADFSDYASIAERIRNKALESIGRFLAQHDYVRAIEIAALFSEADRKQEILLSARQHYADLLASAGSEAEIREIDLQRIAVEELAGNYETAGQLAEDRLHDNEKACALYEKANLYNKAINTLSSSENDKTLLRLAQLHEKGGNLLSAAQLYEEAKEYDHASSLYTQLGNYEKAAACYALHPQFVPTRLAELYEKAGNYEKAIAIYIETDTLESLETAKSIAHSHGLFTHENQIDLRLSKLLTGNTEDVLKCLQEAESMIVSAYSPCLGIDFGTTNSVGAVYNKAQRKVEIVPVPGNEGSFFEPSFFGVDDHSKPLFGEKARMRALVSPDSVAARMKRSIGQGGSFRIGSKTYKAEEISAMIINRIKENAEVYIKSLIRRKYLDAIAKNGIRFPEDKLQEIFEENVSRYEFKDVVLTVPAFYNDNQKRATRDAAEVAGLNVKRLLHEPTAAALAYGFQKQYAGQVAVIDLGGGTLDLSYLEVENGVYDVIEVDGDTKLGGSDIDSAVLNYANSFIRKKYGITLSQQQDAAAVYRLRDACESLKIRLSDLNHSAIELHHFMGCPVLEMPLSREELEKIAAGVLDRYREKLISFRKRIDADHKPGVKYLLVGNATKMPAVSKITKAVFGDKSLTGIDPGTVVAVGAAVEGAVLTGDIKETLLMDVVPYSLGIAVLKTGDNSQQEEISRLIGRGTTIPSVRMQEYTTTKDNQTEVAIRIYQGESSNPSENYFLGMFKLGGILPAKKGEAKIEIRFDIGSDCILTVTAKDSMTGKQNSIRIDGAVTLSPSEKDKLKTYFSNAKNIQEAIQNLEKERHLLHASLESSKRLIQDARKELQEFEVLFAEKVLKNSKNYSASPDVYAEIQDMFLRRDTVPLDLQKYVDQIHSLEHSAAQYALDSFDYNSVSSIEKVSEYVKALTVIRSNADAAADTIQQEVLSVAVKWNRALRGMHPDLTKMTPIEAANSCLASGNYSEAKAYLTAMEQSSSGLSKEAFALLLQCNIRMGLRDDYKKAHQKYGFLFGYTYPDFQHLDAYLNLVADAIVMIAVPEKDGMVSGSGFAIKERTIVTNRHVVDGAAPDSIRIIGMKKNARVSAVEIDPTADLAVLRVTEDFTPLRIGEFNFVSPGEQVIAIGFPSPTSDVYKENIYISKGIVNSIRTIKEQPGRVIFIDAKIGGGMSGGPLINDLGEVIGINTMIQYRIQESEKGPVALENQNIAISAQFLEKYL